MLEACQLTISYQDRQLLHGLSFSMMKGESLAVIGESGAGKSLLAMAILDLLPIELQAMGCLLYHGKNVKEAGNSLRGRSIAYIPQDPLSASFPLYTIQTQWKHVCQAQGKKFDRRDAMSRLAAAGLSQPQRVLQSYPHQLSGGELQRVMVALALSQQPELIIADEPTTALDTVSQAGVLSLLRNYCYKKGASLLFITHDLAIVRHLCHRILILKDGHLVEEGAASAVLESPAQAYTRKLTAAAVKIGAPQEKAAETPDGPPLLEAKKLQVVFAGRFFRKGASVRAVGGLKLRLHSKEICGLAGKSGSGKTTVLRSLAGLIPQATSMVFYKGTALSKLSPQAFREFRKNVQVIFQNPASSLNPRMRVNEVLAEAVSLSPKETNLSVIQLLDWVKLPSRLLEHYPHQLSGGEKQRLCIARSLALKPEILLCDEPASSLDQSLQADLLDLFVYLKKEFNLGILLVSHNLANIRYACNRLAVMEKGEIKEAGPVEKVLDTPISPYTRQLLKAEPALTHNFLLENLHE